MMKNKIAGGLIALASIQQRLPRSTAFAEAEPSVSAGKPDSAVVRDSEQGRCCNNKRARTHLSSAEDGAEVEVCSG